MKNRKVKIVIAYWLRFWHCLYYGITRILSEDHRMWNNYVRNTVSMIGCSCGKKFYHRPFLEIYNEEFGTDFKVEDFKVKIKRSDFI